MKDIKEYLPLYYGCMVARFDSKGERFKDVINHAWLIEAFGKKGKRYYTYKLLLRPLSDMTEEEKQIIENISKIYRGERTLPSFEISKRWAADQTRYLLKQGFDLFGLIESGLAIDSTKLPTNER